MRNVCIILCSLCFSQSEQIFTFYMYRSKKSCVLLNAEKIFLRRENRFRQGKGPAGVLRNVRQGAFNTVSNDFNERKRLTPDS